MNVMRKLRSAASSGGSSSSNSSSPGNRSTSDSPNPTSSSTGAANGRAGEDALLDARIQMSLATLKKLFNEYTHPKEPLSELERDAKLYEMLPLFCKVFSSCPANDMSEKFWDVVAFCQQVSRLMVSEIRKRASNQSTEAASIAIVKFLEVETTEETSSGWMLLATLNLLANGDVSLIQVCLGCICMFFHVRGSLHTPEPLPHVVIYCATFTSYSLLALVGAIRILMTRTSILSSEFLVTLSGMSLHYICVFLIMYSAKDDLHLPTQNITKAFLDHPHFAHSKQQSIAALITGTMYMMHMFHVLDLLMHIKPGDWRLQATGCFTSSISDLMLIRTSYLFVLSELIDDFLCRRCNWYFQLAYSQPLRFRDSLEEETTVLGNMFNMADQIMAMVFHVNPMDSSESLIVTPSITSDYESEESSMESILSVEDEGEFGNRQFWSWRGSSDTTSIWAQIEDNSTLLQDQSDFSTPVPREVTHVDDGDTSNH